MLCLNIAIYLIIVHLYMHVQHNMGMVSKSLEIQVDTLHTQSLLQFHHYNKVRVRVDIQQPRNGLIKAKLLKLTFLKCFQLSSAVNR